MKHKIQIRVRQDIADFFHAHPELRPSVLVDRLLREEYNLPTGDEPKEYTNFTFTLDSDVMIALQADRPLMQRKINALLHRYVRGVANVE